jgi:hypothetical protein
VDKALPATDPVRRLRHGEGSAAWLVAHGYAELAPLVARHPVTRLADADTDTWLAAAPLEALIVAYADKRAGQHLEPMDERFASWTRRYPLGAKHGWDHATAERVLERARRLERDVCDRLDIRPEDVRRIAWTGPALRAAGPGETAAPGVAAAPRGSPQATVGSAVQRIVVDPGAGSGGAPH